MSKYDPLWKYIKEKQGYEVKKISMREKKIIFSKYNL